MTSRWLKWISLFWLLTVFLSLPSPLLAEEDIHYGKVIGVMDGDTIKILKQRTTVKVRLAEIDAPESRQAFGTQAKQTLSSMVFGKEVQIVQRDQDRYGRLVGTVYVDGQNVNAEMVRRGMAWVYRHYAKDPSLLEIENLARIKKRGLWTDPHAIPPWEYRHGNKMMAEATPQPRTKESAFIKGNVNSKIYHWPGCPNYNAILPRNQMLFASKAEAELAGFRAARNCR